MSWPLVDMSVYLTGLVVCFFAGFQVGLTKRITSGMDRFL